MVLISAICLPNFPGRRATRIQALQMLPVLEGVHAGPKAIVGITNQLLFRQQAMEWLDDQLFFIAHVLENLFLEDKKPAIDAYAAVVDGMDPRNQAAVALFQRNQMVAEIRPDTEKAGNLVLLMKVFELF